MSLRTSAELHRLLDARDAKVPAFTHDCDRCIFLGHYSDYKSYGSKGADLDFYDLYVCIWEPTVIARFGDGGSEYTSGNCSSFFLHMPWLALAAEKAIAYMAERLRT